MKTGRVRKKEAAPQAGPAAPKPAAPRPAPRPAAVHAQGIPGSAQSTTGQVGKPANGKIVAGLLIGTFACFALAMIVATALGVKKADTWVPVSQTRGEWTTTVQIWGPQVAHEERWETDCRRDPQATVQPATCILKPTQQYHDQVIDEYDEYAYNIYYEETYQQVYEVRGTEFIVTTLGGDDWWDENLHYVLEEELDKASCHYTEYTTWVDDPDDATHEIEVYLSECEVWDHVTVYERIYEQANWCGCDVIAIVNVGQETRQGTGASVQWASPVVPSGGRTERAFQGTVTFQGDDYTYTTTTTDLAAYQDYVTSQYYIGLDDGQPIKVSKNPQ
ncbi:MAG: hypothetical protein JXA93_04405 [Anaerolineae bacterium]|nr:hypothetical protein [Anaerolineae bacterium]